MNVSEYYEYKKENDKKIDDFNARKEEAEKKERKEKHDKTKEQVKDTIEKTVTMIPHFTKLAGAAALTGLLAAGADKIKNAKKFFRK